MTHSHTQGPGSFGGGSSSLPNQNPRNLGDAASLLQDIANSLVQITQHTQRLSQLSTDLAGVMADIHEGLSREPVPSQSAYPPHGSSQRDSLGPSSVRDESPNRATVAMIKGSAVETPRPGNHYSPMQPQPSVHTVNWGSPAPHASLHTSADPHRGNHGLPQMHAPAPPSYAHPNAGGFNPQPPIARPQASHYSVSSATEIARQFGEIWTAYYARLKGGRFVESELRDAVLQRLGNVVSSWSREPNYIILTLSQQPEQLVLPGISTPSNTTSYLETLFELSTSLPQGHPPKVLSAAIVPQSNPQFPPIPGSFTRGRIEIAQG